MKRLAAALLASTALALQPAQGQTVADSAKAAIGAWTVPFAKYASATLVPGAGTAGNDATAAFYGYRNPTTGVINGGILQDTTSPTIYLPDGEYDISACPTPKKYWSSNVALIGAGHGRTVIKLTGANCGDTLFAWAGQNHIRVSGITFDMNHATAASPASSVILVGNGHDGYFADLEFLNLKGDYWFPFNVVGFHNGRLTGSKFVYDAPATTDATGAFALLNSYLGSTNTGSITFSGGVNILTVSAQQGGSGVAAGEAITGHNVPYRTFVAAQVTPLASGETTGGVGRYALTTPGNVPISVPTGTSIYSSSNYDWTVDHTTIVNSILVAEGPYFKSENNDISGWCSGAALTIAAPSQFFESHDDRLHNGCHTPDINAVFDTAAEEHADDSKFYNPTIFDVASVCIGINGLNTQVHGGTCSKFNQGATLNSTFTGHIKDGVLTVDSGTIYLGMVIAGAGISNSPVVETATAVAGAKDQFNLTSSPADVASETMTASANTYYDAMHFTSNGSNAAGSVIEGMTIQSSGTPGEKFCIGDESGVVGTFAKNNTCIGATVAPYNISAGTVVVDPAAGMKVSQLANVRANRGTALGITDAASPRYGGLLTGGGSAAALAIGNGSTFVAH